MVVQQDILSSEFCSELSSSNSVRCEHSSPDSVYDIFVIRKNLKLAWTGDFSSIKAMVTNYLKLEGELRSPRSGKKTFYIIL